MKTVLHAGCGPKGTPIPERFNGWEEIRLDANAAVEPDIVADIASMPNVANDSMDAVFSSHTLEHLYAHEADMALLEFYRVLKPGGQLLLTLPDFQQAAAYIARGQFEDVLYDSAAGPITALDVCFGLRCAVAKGNTFMAHRNGFSPKTLENSLTKAGFDEVRVQTGVLDMWADAKKEPTMTLTLPGSPQSHLQALPLPKQAAIAHCTLGRPGAPVSLWWARAIGNITWPFNVAKAPFMVEDDLGKNIAEGRNMLIAKVMEKETPSLEFTKILWIDDDVIPISHLLLRALDSHDADVCAGVYFSKDEYPQPLIFPAMGRQPDKFVPDKCYEVWGVGMGLTLVKMDVYRRMRDELKLPLDKNGNPQWYKTPGEDGDLKLNENGIMEMGGTEDLYFCGPVVPEIVFSQHLPLFAGRQLPVGPKEWRDVLPAKLGLRLRAVEDVRHDRRDDGLCNVLDGPWLLPRQPVRQGVHRYHDPDPHDAEVEAQHRRAVCAHDDVVHVPGEPGQHHHRHMADEEDDEGAHDEEVERTPDLPVAGQVRIPLEAVRKGR
jgi:hypothetical protein